MMENEQDRSAVLGEVPRANGEELARIRDLVVAELSRRLSDLIVDRMRGPLTHCNGGCKGNCAGICHGSCAGSCVSDCAGDCSGTCSGDCAGTNSGKGGPDTKINMHPDYNNPLTRYLADTLGGVIDAYQDVLLRGGYPK